MRTFSLKAETSLLHDCLKLKGIYVSAQATDADFTHKISNDFMVKPYNSELKLDV